MKLDFFGLTLIFAFISLVSGFILIIILMIFINKSREKAKLRLSLNYKLFLIEIPKFRLITEHKEERPRLIDEIAVFENFLNSLASIKSPVVLEMASPHNEEEIFFYIAIHKKYADSIYKIIHGLWPGSQILPLPQDFNPFHPQGSTFISEVLLKENEYLPIRTYKELALGNIDPLEALWSAKIIAYEEGAALQIILIPESSKINKKIYDIVKKLKEGIKLKDALGKSWTSTLSEIFKPPKKPEEKSEKFQTIDEESVKNLSTKANKVLFRVNIRLVASSHNQSRADEILSSMEQVFHQFALPGANSFEIRRIKKNWKKTLYNFSFRLFDRKTSILLNSEELSSIFHFPTSYTKASRIHFLTIRTVPPPVNLPEEGIVLGDVIYPGVTKIARLTRDDRRRHFYIIGQTGTGKTNFLKYLIHQDIENGEGVCFIDPHGDVAEELLSIVPKSRVEDVVYFSPGDTQRVMGLNILEYDKSRPEDKTFIIDTLIEIIDKLYNLRETGGPLFEQTLRFGLLLTMDDPEWGYTLLDFPKVLTDDVFRKSLLDKCKNPVVIQYWTKEAFLARGETSFQNLVTWVTSKLNPFLTNDFVRPIIAQSKTTLDFWNIINNQKILIVNLSKGKLGETTAYLLGMIVIMKLLLSAFRRTIIPEEERKDFYLYVDEFQNFAFKSIPSILSEARKYRLSMIMAHQYIKQLPEELINAIVGNVGSMQIFRVGEHDAEFFEKLLSPQISKYDILNIPNYHAYAKILIKGFPATPFALKTRKAPSGDKSYGEKVKELSLLKYALSKEEVEEEIVKKYFGEGQEDIFEELDF